MKYAKGLPPVQEAILEPKDWKSWSFLYPTSELTRFSPLTPLGMQGEPAAALALPPAGDALRLAR